jgi:hypothetical protein
MRREGQGPGETDSPPVTARLAGRLRIWIDIPTICMDRQARKYAISRTPGCGSSSSMTRRNSPNCYGRPCDKKRALPEWLPGWFKTSVVRRPLQARRRPSLAGGKPNADYLRAEALPRPPGERRIELDAKPGYILNGNLRSMQTRSKRRRRVRLFRPSLFC